MAHQSTILVVDDNEALRYAITRALQAGGYKVLEASTGLSALQLAMQAPDLITLDIKLPDIDGFEVCRRLRSEAETKGIPVLHISASFVAPEDKVRALEGGADGYLAEPITKDELLATVRALLRMKEAEEEVRRRERELRFLADSIPHLVWIADATGRPLYFNVRWFDFTGMTESESLNKGWLELVHPDDLPRISTLWRDSLESGKRFNAEARYRTATGEFRWMVIRAVKMQQENSSGAQWFGTSTDITEEKRREEMLRQTERLALAGRLAASIAHEINNPLEAVTNIFYILETSKDLDPSLMDMVRIGSSELKRVAHIVRQSLSYYKNSEKAADVDISDLLEETLRVLDHHLVANKVSVIRKYEAHTKIKVFSSEIRQVFSNLILNAVEAMPNGGQLIVKTSDARDRRTGGKPGVRVTVADTGVGIAASDRARVFDAFFTTKLDKGTGLGLWVSNDIIMKHGGKITARSSTTPGRSGTVFSIFLPA